MSRPALFSLFAAVLLAVMPVHAQNAAPPDFAPSANIGWIANTSEFMAPASGPGPVMDDPAHPYVSNAISARTGKLPTFPVGDAGNPILQPWAREAVRKSLVLLKNEGELLPLRKDAKVFVAGNSLRPPIWS